MSYLSFTQILGFHNFIQMGLTLGLTMEKLILFTQSPTQQRPIPISFPLGPHCSIFIILGSLDYHLDFLLRKVSDRSLQCRYILISSLFTVKCGLD